MCARLSAVTAVANASPPITMGACSPATKCRSGNVLAQRATCRTGTRTRAAARFPPPQLLYPRLIQRQRYDRSACEAESFPADGLTLRFLGHLADLFVRHGEPERSRVTPDCGILSCGTVLAGELGIEQAPNHWIGVAFDVISSWPRQPAC